MSLRARFALWFGGAALLPIVGTALVTFYLVSNRYQAEFDRTLRTAEEDARRELSAVSESVTRSVEGLASRENPLVGGVLVELEKDGELSPEQRRQLKQGAPTTARSLGLDVLLLSGPDDTVLAAPHFAPHVDEIDPGPRKLAKAGVKGTVAAWHKVFRGSQLVNILTVDVARTVVDRGQEVSVLGGREIGPELLARLHRDLLIAEARLVDSSGTELFTTEKNWARLKGAPSIEVAIAGESGAPVARLQVAVPDDELRSTLRQVAVATAGLGAFAVLAAMFLGMLVSRRITRDLDRLIAGAQAVSRGELDHKVNVPARDEVGEVASAFNAMTRDLVESKARLIHAERVAAWQEIARSLAHEIKNPLTPIQMSVETMRKTRQAEHPSFGEIFEESTLTILEEVQRLKRIVSEFSQFARMPTPERRACDMNDVVGSAVGLYRGAVRVVRELGDGLPAIRADRDQLTQVVLNLLENARDAVASRGSEQSVGRITVRTLRGGAGITLEVEDNGPGFDPAVKERLFSPYFTTKGESGTGLGLAIVHRIVTEHGGRVSASSDPGKGARFIVELPA